MDLSKISLLALRYMRPWALNLILGYGSPRYTPEDLDRRTRRELIAEAKTIILAQRQANGHTGKWTTVSRNKAAAQRKKRRIIQNVTKKTMTVEEADNIRLNDDILYSIWKDEWFDIDMRIATEVRSSDTT